MDVFSRTVGKESIGIIVRNYNGDVLSVNDRFLALAGVVKDASDVTIDDFPWRNLKLQSDAADILAKSGDVREMVNLYFHTIRQEWVQAVSVKFSHQPTSVPGLPLEWGGQPVIYILMMDVSHISRALPAFRSWAQGTYVDFEKEKIVFPDGSSLSRSDLICLSYYLEDFPQSDIAEHMNQSIKTVEKRIAAIKSTLFKIDPGCTNLYELCRRYGVRQVLELKRDWFDKESVAAQITNMQWQGNHDMYP
jgi:hypothetical protein